MSTAWVYGVVGVHNWQLALFDERAQQDVGDDPATLIASTYMPVGRVTPVDGGFRLSGHWKFSSGSELCEWVFLGALVPPAVAGQPPEYRTFLLPKADYRIQQDWDVLGLRATGSHDIVVDDVFVPAYRTHKAIDGMMGTAEPRRQRCAAVQAAVRADLRARGMHVVHRRAAGRARRFHRLCGHARVGQQRREDDR